MYEPHLFLSDKEMKDSLVEKKKKTLNTCVSGVV
jgi:hypothetical protein